MENGRNRMRIPMVLAAVLMAGTFFLHVIGGGAEVHVPIQASSLDLTLRAVSAVLWHAVSVLLVIQTGALVWLARHPNPPMAMLLITIQLAFVGLFLFYGQTMLGTVWVMGQWTIFLALAALIAWGLRGQVPRAAV
jgi:hypothetical protein